jgi:putative aldouronate transport system substrate-binding protein
MKRNTKLLALLLALAMMVGMLAACGSSTTSTTTETTASAETSEETTAASEEAPAASEEAAPAASEEAAAPAAEEAEEAPAEEEPAAAGDAASAMAQEFISYPLAGDDNVITMWYYIPGYVDFMDSNYNFNALSAAEEATGVRLEFTEVSSASTSELFNLMVAGGDMCDLIPCLEYYTGGISKAYDEDVIIDIGEYVDEYMPNYAAVMDTLDPSVVADTLTDGHLLAFYQIADGTYSANGYITRGDWLDELGITFSGDVISLDEYTELLRAIHTAYDTPYTYYMTDGTMGLDAAFDTAIPVLQGDGFMTMVTSTVFRYGDTVASGWTTDGYRAYIEWVREMMDEGILYSDFLSLDNDRGVTNTLQGSGEIAVWQANADKMEEILGYTDDPNFTVTAVPRVAADPDAEYVWDDEAALVSSNAGFSISSSCQNPELVCQWMNYFWTTDGYMMANYGIEGESYDVLDDGSIDFTWERPITVTGRNAPNAEMAQTLFTMMRFVGFYSDNDRLLSTFPDSALAAVDLWTLTDREHSDQRNYPSALSNGFTVEENEEIAKYENDFLTYAQETALKFMTGALELNDDSWNEYVSTCESMGLNDILAVYQTAYDQYLAGER